MNPDLRHHGDRDVAPGLVDLAVNVRLPAPPPWLADVVAASLAGLGRYPDASAARAAVAARHAVDPACVLPTSGAAEAFVLVARGLGARRPVVVHPQFTEPDVALHAAGTPPRHHVLRADDGFVLDPRAFEAEHPDADLVVVGNPTNPTGVLHPAATLRALVRPGRVLVVDEAFMDAVPGEPDSLLAGDLPPGVLVLRSLTKTWGLAGLRAGYVVGDPTLVALLAQQQPPWSVSTPALAATVACLGPRALDEAAAAALEARAHRAVLVGALEDAGLSTVAGEAPFVLAETSSLGSGSVRAELADLGFAVRRGETFPGLGPTWVRLAVRDPATTRRLADALSILRRNRSAA